MPLLELLQSQPVVFVLVAIAIIEAIALHEFAHAFAADLQGDRLPRALGRLTLNPAKHLDPLGTLLIFVAGFGWGKPVEFRLEALSSKRFGAAIVALAGPGMNVLLALVAAGALAVINPPAFSMLDTFLRFFVGINVLLAVFNLIPIPPLDGSRLLTIFLPPRRHNVIFFLDRYGTLILLFFVFFGARRVLGPVLTFVDSIVQGLT